MEHTTFLPRSTSDQDTGERRAPDGSASSLVADAASQLSHWDRLALASGAVFVVVILALLLRLRRERMLAAGPRPRCC